MVTSAIDLILTEHRGKAAVSLLKNKRIPAGTLLIEAFYQVACKAPQYLQVERFLPTTVLRCLLNSKGQNMDKAVSHHQLNQQCVKADKSFARKVVESQQTLLEPLLKNNQTVLEQQADEVKAQALAAMQE